VPENGKTFFMKTGLSILLLLIATRLVGQKVDDTKIIITLDDSLGSYEKVKTALVKNNFILKEDSSKNRITTYPREFDNMPGYAITNVEISGNIVTLSGIYGLNKKNYWGDAKKPRDYKPIIYFKGSKGWRLLMQIAKDIGGQLSYSK
jgi:hypothetical protein